jgi:H+/Cl- antiporter ClcA
MDISMIGWLLFLCIGTGLLGGFYTFLYNRTTKIIKRKEGNVFLKVLAGSLAAALLAWAVNPQLMGTSTDIIPALFSPAEGKIALLSGRISFIPSLGFILIVMFFAKIVCNCITVGCGMSAGFTGPAAISGMFLGAALANFLNIDITSPTYFAFLAAGFSGFLASSMNIPLAAAIMTTDIFGMQHGFPAALAAVIGFQIMRHETIYDYALAGAGLSVDE